MSRAKYYQQYKQYQLVDSMLFIQVGSFLDAVEIFFGQRWLNPSFLEKNGPCEDG